MEMPGYVPLLSIENLTDKTLVIRFFNISYVNLLIEKFKNCVCVCQAVQASQYTHGTHNNFRCALCFCTQSSNTTKIFVREVPLQGRNSMPASDSFKKNSPLKNCPS